MGWIRQSAAVCVVLCLACADADGERAGTAEAAGRDSAGIRIIEHDAAALAGLAEWTLVPDLTIGTDDGESYYALHQVRGAVTLSDGTIAVLNAGSWEVRYYTERGEYAGAVGRYGSGPGDFRFMGMLQRLPGDTLAVFDAAQRRLTYISPERTVSTQQGPHWLNGAVALLGPQRLLMAAPRRNVPRGNALVDMPMDVVIVDLAAETADTLRTLPWQTYQVTDGERVRDVRLPFSVMPQVRAAQAGFAAYDPSTVQVVRYDYSGALTHIIRIDADGGAVEHARLTAFIAAEVERERVPRLRAELRRAYDTLSPPQQMPPFAAIAMASDGSVWLRRYEPVDPALSEETARWLVIDPDGRPHASVTAPAGLLVHEIGPHHVLATRTDGLDVQRVIRYRITRLP